MREETFVTSMLIFMISIRILTMTLMMAGLWIVRREKISENGTRILGEE